MENSLISELVDDPAVRTILADDEGVPVVALAGHISLRYGLDDRSALELADRVAGIIDS